MKVNIKQHSGTWSLGYSLDKHVISSTPSGYSEYGHLQFDTIRTEAGEALFQLKYRSDLSQIPVLAQQLHTSFGYAFSSAGLVIPMPPSKHRSVQPVIEIAKQFSALKGIPCYENLLVKTKDTPSMKDIGTREEKVSELMNAFTVYDVLPEGEYDVLIIDDLLDTGASLEAATNKLRGYNKIRNIYISTVTRKR